LGLLFLNNLKDFGLELARLTYAEETYTKIIASGAHEMLMGPGHLEID
jgi:hypothetical protein